MPDVAHTAVREFRRPIVQAHGTFQEYATTEPRQLPANLGESRLRTTTETTTVRLPENVIKSKESDSCWSGGTGRRTGLKSQTIGSRRAISLALCTRSADFGNARITRIFPRSSTEPLQSFRDLDRRCNTTLRP